MARLRLVPWEPTWLTHQTLDLHAIYRRPVRDPETWQVLRDDDGFERWDLTTALPIRQHVRFLQKGFHYVTLATAEDVLHAAAPAIAERGATPLGRGNRRPDEHPDDYLRQPGIRGPWNAAAYLADMKDAHRARVEEVEAHLEMYGPDGAEEFERQRDPDYRLPARYREAVTAGPVKRKRGRPPGSKNKPKEEVVTA